MAEPAAPVKKGVPFSHFLDPEDVSATKVGSQVCDLFDTYKKYVVLAEEAVASFFKGDLPDPKVGENACQIRATMYADAYNSQGFFDVLEEARSVLEKVHKQLEKVPAPSKKEKSSLRAFLKATDVDFTLDERVYNFVSGYLLHVHETSVDYFAKDLKGKVQPLATDTETNVLVERGFSKGTVKRLRKVAQKQLAFASVKAVQTMALGLPNVERQRLYPMVSGDQVKVTDHQQPVVPCFSVGEIIFSHACANKIPIVVRIHQVDAETAVEKGQTLFFFKSNGAKYTPAVFDDFSGKEAAIMTDSASISYPVLTKGQLEKEMYSRSIVETLMAFMAVHPSYGGGLKNHPGPEEEFSRREPYAMLADEWGCSVEDPLVCRPFHMYPIVLAKLKL